MPQQHLAEVHQVEERADAGRVERVLAVGGDPLGVEVLLGQVAGEALHDRGQEGDHAGDPGQAPAAAPGGHPELAPQVDDQQRHEQLDAPQVQAVEEVTDRVGVPPVGAAERDGEAAHDGHAERGQRGDAEHVHPGGHVGRLAVRQQLVRRQRGQRAAAGPRRPHPLVTRRDARVRRRVRDGGVLAAGPGERQQQRDAEDDDHHRDQDQVRHGNREDVPVQVRTRLVQVEGGGSVSRQDQGFHQSLQVDRQSIVPSLSAGPRGPVVT